MPEQAYKILLKRSKRVFSFLSLEENSTLKGINQAITGRRGNGKYNDTLFFTHGVDDLIISGKENQF